MPATSLQVLRGLLLAAQLAVFIILFTWIFGYLGGVSLRPVNAGFAAGSNDTNRSDNFKCMACWLHSSDYMPAPASRPASRQEWLLQAVQLASFIDDTRLDWFLSWSPACIPLAICQGSQQVWEQKSTPHSAQHYRSWMLAIRCSRLLFCWAGLQLRRQQQKTLHATLNTAALVTAILAVTAAWKSHTLKRPVPIPNLYSPHRCIWYQIVRHHRLGSPFIPADDCCVVWHSWLGVLTLSLAVIQLLIGFGTYVWPKLSATRRAAAYPYHAFLGTVTFATALATILTGMAAAVFWTLIYF
jgi:Eukaryotic cytochrome b561